MEVCIFPVPLELAVVCRALASDPDGSGAFGARNCSQLRLVLLLCDQCRFSLKELPILVTMMNCEACVVVQCSSCSASSSPVFVRACSSLG